MPVQVSYPGVYIQEVSSGVRTITGVSTSIAAFVGMVQRGQLNVPTNVLNYTDYERTFGSDTSVSEMTDQVRLFFQNGGRNAYIMRIADASVSRAQVTVSNEFGAATVVFEAKEAGLIGDSIRITVDYNTARPESTFNLGVSRETVVNGEFDFIETESHRDLSMDPAAGRFIATVLERDSLLVSAAMVSSPLIPPDLIQGYSAGGVLLADGSEITQINAVIGAGNTGRFDISVDGRAFVTVPLEHPVADDNGMTTTINNALATSTGGQVTVTTARAVSAGGPRYLLITSNTEGGSVRIRSAAVNDIAADLGLGQDNGGLEVDGYALRRPAPTGFFSQLGASLDVVNDANALDALGQFLATTHGPSGTLDMVTLVDSIDGTNSVTPVYVGSDGDAMWVGTATSADSLLNGGQNLNAIADAIDSSETIRWSAQQYGYRIILTPEFGSSDGDLMVDINSPAIGTGTTGIFDQESNVVRYRLGGYTLPAGTYDYIHANQGGDDGEIPAISDYSAAFDKIASDVDLFNLLILPRALVAPGQSDSARAALWGPASIFCQERRAFLLVDPPGDWGTVQDITDRNDGIEPLRRGSVNDHAAIYWPRLQIVDPISGGQRHVDPAGAIAGVMARTDANRGVWKAPAGLEADIRGVRGLQFTISDPQNGLINPQAVNALRIFPNGIVSWGARTMDGFDNSGNNDYRYVPIRRIALFIEESLFRGLKFAVFEPNDEPLWAQIRLAAGAFMNNLFRQGAFQGQKARDAYFVKVDSETTTQNDINLGIVNVVVGFAPLRPAEFVVITLQQMAGQVQT